MKSLNSALYFTHRWLGVALGLFMTVWLASGFIIMFASPTTLSRAQQLQFAEPLLPQADWLSLGEVWRLSKLARQAREMPVVATEPHGNAKHNAVDPDELPLDGRLLRINETGYWLAEDGAGRRFALSATDGFLAEFDSLQAIQIATHWAARQHDSGFAHPVWLETVENPVILRNQDALKPFHRVEFDNGTQLLISARTGEVLHASGYWQRLGYWAGNWLHTFKPLESLGWGKIRHDVQFWSGLLALIAAITGFIIGCLRWRPGWNGRPTYSQGRSQPYREFWFKWHFWAGLIGGLFAVAWCLSGFLEINPWKLFSQPNASREELRQFSGAKAPTVFSAWQPAILEREIAPQDNIVEADIRRIGPETIVLLYGRDGSRVALDKQGLSAQFSAGVIREAVQRVAKDNAVDAHTLLSEYDSYYYPRRHQTPVDKPLPVIRAELNNPDNTLLYIDPQDGRVLSKLDRNRRAYRWLYSALHHWDFAWLYYQPLWYVWMSIWVGLGLILGITSLVIGWRRLKRSVATKSKAAPSRQPSEQFAVQNGD
jgi:uncharacterized iron-regulated membrane protein